MKINQINISHAIILTLIHNTANKNNDGQGYNFSFTPNFGLDSQIITLVASAIIPIINVSNIGDFIIMKPIEIAELIQRVTTGYVSLQ
jgi:hypothetical protein